MGFKDDVREKAGEFEAEIEALKIRVTGLEGLANQLRAQGMPASVQGTTRSDYSRPVTNRAGQYTHTTTEATGVDYGAIAFGLSDLRRKARNAGVPGVTDTLDGAVQYFSDVFAKSDPQFNAAEFARLANA